ncbi:MAG: hypothetical protein M3342_22960 [Bacteroidota bacterium]|nr:hypothetical protein [Bacteroidota bacterium]
MKCLFFSLSVVAILSCRQSSSPEKDLLQINQFLPSANWQVIDNRDTFYLFFAQNPDHTYTIYEYRIRGGDSSDTRTDSIAVADNTVRWQFRNKELYFDEKRDSTLIWNEALKPEQKYVLRQVSDSLMMLQLPDQNEKMVFRKMLPFTTFLIRFRYDYLHGTRTVDSPEILPRNMRRK